MTRRKAFRPALRDALEARIALSTAVAGHQAVRTAEVQSATATSTLPSYEELTTTYANGNAGTIVGVGKITGTTETEYRLIVPTSGNATTTTESITLPGTAGHETIVDVTMTQGSTTTDNITTTLPDGTISTKNQTQVKHGDRSVFNASLDAPGVGVQTTKGTIFHTGQKTITNERITTAGGKVYNFHRVVTRTNPLESSAISTTTGPGGAVTNQVKSTTTVTLLPLPAS